MAARITDAARMPRPDTAHKIKHALHVCVTKTGAQRGGGWEKLHVVKLRCITAAIVGTCVTTVCVWSPERGHYRSAGR